MRLASLMTRARTSRFRGAWVAALGLLISATAGAQNGTISGKITEQTSGEPVTSAAVNVSRPGGGPVAATRSLASGAYTVANLPAGTYTVSVTARIGLAPKHVDNVVVRAGQTTSLDFAMSPIARQLEQVVTTATGGAQPERIQDSPNPISVVTATQIAERPSASITDHLKAVPGLSISTGGIAQANIVSRGFNNAFSTQMLMLQDYRYAGVPSLRVNVPLLVHRHKRRHRPHRDSAGTRGGALRPELRQRRAARHHEVAVPVGGTTLTLDGGERSLLRG